MQYSMSVSETIKVGSTQLTGHQYSLTTYSNIKVSLMA